MGLGRDYLSPSDGNLMRRKSLSDAIRVKDTLFEMLETNSNGRRELFQCLLKISRLHLEPGTPYRDISSCLQYLAQSIGNNQCDIRSRLKQIIPVLQDLDSEVSEGFPTFTPVVRAELVNIYAEMTRLLPHVAFFGLNLSARYPYLASG
jgi:hypothetical protein